MAEDERILELHGHGCTKEIIHLFFVMFEVYWIGAILFGKFCRDAPFSKVYARSENKAGIMFMFGFVSVLLGIVERSWLSVINIWFSSGAYAGVPEIRLIVVSFQRLWKSFFCQLKKTYDFSDQATCFDCGNGSQISSCAKWHLKFIHLYLPIDYNLIS